MNRILVTGATGHLGGAVIETLLQELAAGQISIITRKEAQQAVFASRGFQAFVGSYDHVPALQKAMEGVDTVLLISSGDQGNRLQEHKNVIDTAVQMGVKHFAYTSRCLSNRSALANKLMVEHFETEDHIRASGLQYMLFRNALYMDAIHQFVGGNMALERGILLPAGNGKVAFALRSDLGAAIAKSLLTGRFHNSIYHFTGSQAYSFYDVADALSELTGKPVKYTDVNTESFASGMRKRDLPEPMIQKINDFITDIRHNQEAEVYDDLERQLGRKPVNLKDGLKSVFAL